MPRATRASITLLFGFGFRPARIICKARRDSPVLIIRSRIGIALSLGRILFIHSSRCGSLNFV
jgi:hypothetical protein